MKSSCQARWRRIESIWGRVSDAPREGAVWAGLGVAGFDRAALGEVNCAKAGDAAKLKEAIASAEGWAREAGTPLDVSGLRSRADGVATASTALEQRLDQRLTAADLPAATLPALNDRLARMEQKLADDDGAPETKWYRHVFYGWNIYSLYDGQPFPGLANALRRQDAPAVTREVKRLGRALERVRAELERLAAEQR